MTAAQGGSTVEAILRFLFGFISFYDRISLLRLAALKDQVQHFGEKMLHGKNLHAVEY